MVWKKEVFSEFSFDENLKSYAYMEDVLFSHFKNTQIVC